MFFLPPTGDLKRYDRVIAAAVVAESLVPLAQGEVGSAVASLLIALVPAVGIYYRFREGFALSLALSAFDVLGFILLVSLSGPDANLHLWLISTVIIGVFCLLRLRNWDPDASPSPALYATIARPTTFIALLLLIIFCWSFAMR